MSAPLSTSSEAAARVPARKRIIGIAELHASSSADDTLVTYALGSCLGITMYDPAKQIGGLVHAMLPSSTLNLQRAEADPATFVDTGVIALLEECTRLGAKRSQIIITAVGGAMHGGSEHVDRFQIGRRNVVALQQLLRQQGLALRASDIGGQFSRNLSLSIRTGEVQVSRYVNSSLHSMS